MPSATDRHAIERAERDRPDIVLADVGMPERDGYEVAAFIKGNPSLAHVPVVLLTGAFEPIDENRARAVGCDGVLVKPFEPQMVISRVKDLLAGRRPSDMWGSGPAAQGPVRVAAGEFDLRPSATTSASGDPLEAYFDRLDAAFSAKGGAAAPEAPRRRSRKRRSRHHSSNAIRFRCRRLRLRRRPGRWWTTSPAGIRSWRAIPPGTSPRLLRRPRPFVAAPVMWLDGIRISSEKDRGQRCQRRHRRRPIGPPVVSIPRRPPLAPRRRAVRGRRTLAG